MQIQRVLFSLLLACLVCATSVAQEEKTETVNPKKAKAAAKAIKSMTTQMLKSFEAANLTDEQKEKVGEIIESNIASVQEARKAQDGLLTDEQKQARKDALAKAKEDGLKGQKAFKAAVSAMGLSDEKLAEYKAAQKTLSAAQKKIKDAITELLTDEQKASLPKRGGNKKKGGKKEKADAETSSTSSNGETQTVFLSLPGMT